MTTAARHPARTIEFDSLIEGLEEARAAGLVYRRDDRATGRSLYCYTSRCVYETAWTDITMLARGLVVDLEARRVVATPFPKFFNAGEGGHVAPDLPFQTFDKLDGSLAIVHHYGGRWRAATKGAFDSDQAKWVESWLEARDLSALKPGVTYLAEAIYPDNRIVVRYDQTTLVLLAAYGEDGTELAYEEIENLAEGLGWPVAKRRSYASLAQLLTDTRYLPKTAEGFVIRFSDGSRLKMKGEEYRRIHALISRCTPLALWEAMAAGDDMGAIRKDLPEEFWDDFDRITALLQAKFDKLTAEIAKTAAGVAHLSDKELGLIVNTLPAETGSYVFGFRKSGGKFEPRVQQKLFRQIRPTANELEGYVPSYAMGRLMEEAS